MKEPGHLVHLLAKPQRQQGQMSSVGFFHSHIILRAVINCITLIIISSDARSSADIQFSLGRAAVVDVDILTRPCGFGSCSQLLWCLVMFKLA